MTSTLHIQLLGRFRLTFDATPITTLDSPRLQALLAYLLVHRAAPHARAPLAFQLWLDTTEAQAHANLRTLLHRLRQALPDADRFLHVDAQTVQWRADARFTLDVADIERALAQAEAAERAGDHALLRRAFEQAAARYQGDLLPECYDDWVLVERERLRQAFLAGLEKLVLLLEQANEYAAAIGYAQRLLRHDPLQEATYQHLMRLHAASGDRASAVRVYHTCATVLARELGVEPSPATREAYEHLLRMDLPPAPSAVPPTAAPLAKRHNLPIALTSFIGRTREIAEVTQLLSTTRLLTLTGPGGCGKTRLALAVVRDLVAAYPDGVWLVDLAALADTALVPQAVAMVLGVREEPQRSLAATLVDALRPRTLLLVLDNCEHLLDTCAHLAETLLSAGSRLRILATSREPLGVAGETSWSVPSLSLPDPAHPPALTDLMRSEAVELFRERAASALPTFTLMPENAAAVAQVCRRLDGIPLAIELAAVRVKVLSVTQLATRLDDCFRLLTGGGRTAIPRHQSLRATIDWSCALLVERQRALFHRLSVFAGGWTVEAAEAVCAGAGLAGDEILEVLAHLVDKSLVMVEAQAGGEARCRLLETIRQYALEKLAASGEADAVRRQHAAYYLVRDEWPGEFSQEWMNHTDREHDNLRAALAWSQTVAGDAETALRLAVILGIFWFACGYWSEARGELERALSHPHGAGRTHAQAAASRVLAEMLANQGDYAAGQTQFERSLLLYRELGNMQEYATLQHRLGWLARERGDAVTARAQLEASLALHHELGDTLGAAWALTTLAEVAILQEDAARAEALLKESEALGREHNVPLHRGWMINHLGHVAQLQGEYSHATRLHEESLAVFQELLGDRNWGVAWARHGLGETALAQGDPARAKTWLAASLALFRDLGDRSGIAWCLMGLGSAAALAGQADRAARLWGAGEGLRQAIGARPAPCARTTYERARTAARPQLGDAAFAAGWAEGQAMPLKQAIAEALDGTDLLAESPAGTR